MAIETITKTQNLVTPVELRERVRHRLAADAVFMWQSAQHTSLHGEGVTRDISLTGAFIFSLTSPPVGAAIQLDVVLLPLDGRARTLRLKTNATVIRVEHVNADTDEGFAVVIEGLNLAQGGNNLHVEQMRAKGN